MDGWTLDILRQERLDWWVWVCAAALLLAASRLIVGRMWRSWAHWALIAGVAAGAVGLLAICASGAGARWGILWSIYCAVLTTTVLYWGFFQHLGWIKGGVIWGLRVAVLGLLVLMLFEPVVRYAAASRPERRLYLVVDASASMSVPDIQNGPTRIQSVWEAIRGSLPDLRRHFDLQVRTFAQNLRDLEKAEDLTTIRAEGQSTDIVKALAAISDEQGDKSGTELVIISDGHDNVNFDVAKKAAALGRVVHTVGVGSEQAQAAGVANVAVENVELDGDGGDLVVGQEGNLKVRITNSGLANRVVEVKWTQVGEDGAPAGGEVGSRKVVLEDRREGQEVILPFTPKSVGPQRVAVWIEAIPGERTTVDNRQEFQGLAMDPRIKVLYVEGRARPEYRELKRALDRDANIEAASLLRLQGEKFTSAGTVGGQKVNGLPRTAEAWRRFDVIILGDLDASFLNKAQQEAIEKAVADGTGLLMIGGQSSFGPGGYGGGALEKALPVYVGSTDAGQSKSQFVPRLTNSGAAHPAMEGLADWFGQGGEPAKKQLPQLKGNVVVPKAKTGAEVLLIHEGESAPAGAPEIVLATEQYGKGRSAAFTADTTYLWYLPLRGMGQDSPYNRFWGQLVRWLAGADVKNRQQGANLAGMLSRTVIQPAQTVQLKAVVRDERGDATRYADVQAEITKSGAKKEDLKRLSLAPAESRTGLYVGNISGLEAGEWDIKLLASKDGKALGEKRLKLTVMPPAEELLDLAARPAILAELAQRTKGWNYPLAQWSELVRQLAKSDAAAASERQVTVPLANLARIPPALLGHPAKWPTKYDLPMQAALVISLLMLEWLLRRRWPEGQTETNRA